MISAQLLCDECRQMGQSYRKNPFGARSNQRARVVSFLAGIVTVNQFGFCNISADHRANRSDLCGVAAWRDLVDSDLSRP